MRRSQFVALAIAAISALAAVLLAKELIIGTINDQAGRFSKIMQQQNVEVAMVVTAAKELPVGTELTRDMLHEVRWPTETVPAGAFRSVEEMFAIAKRRVVLTSFRAGEPVLPTKITPAGERASLSANLRPGMKAVTVRVNDVIGVAGFVLPGDRVDILMTRDKSKSGGETNDSDIFNDVILQDVRVLAVDQSTDESGATPLPAQTVTVEVAMVDAQKLALAATIGNLSLALRELKAESAPAEVERITVADLVVDKQILSNKSLEGGIVTPAPNLIPLDQEPVGGEVEDDGHVTITVIRATKEQEYRVPPR